MYHTVQFSKKINIKSQYNSKISITDFFVIIAITGVSWFIFKGFFSPLLQLLPALVSAGISFILVSPSGIPEKKNYQMILQTFRRPRKVYHAIQDPYLVKTFREEE